MVYCPTSKLETQWLIEHLRVSDVIVIDEYGSD